MKTMLAVLAAVLTLSAGPARADWKKDANRATDRTERSLKSGAHKAKVKTDRGAHKMGRGMHKAEDKTGRSLQRTGNRMRQTSPSPSPTTGEKNR